MMTTRQTGVASHLLSLLGNSHGTACEISIFSLLKFQLCLCKQTGQDFDKRIKTWVLTSREKFVPKNTSGSQNTDASLLGRRVMHIQNYTAADSSMIEIY